MKQQKLVIGIIIGLLLFLLLGRSSSVYFDYGCGRMALD